MIEHITDELTDEQKDRLFRRLIVSASDILADEFGLPKKTFEEIQEMIEGSDKVIAGQDVGED